MDDALVPASQAQEGMVEHMGSDGETGYRYPVAVAHVRLSDTWVQLADLTSEQIAYLREQASNALSLDINEMLAHAWDKGVEACKDIGGPDYGPWPTDNPYRRSS